MALAQAVEEASSYSKTGFVRLSAMATSIDRLDFEHIEGDIVECGVWRGGSIILARRVSPNRVCWLYDTFSGMVEPGVFDTKKNGRTAAEMFAAKKDKGMAIATLDEVRQNLKLTNTLNDTKLRFIVGRVEDTLHTPSNLPDKIALLRLDTDWYESTKVELEVLYPRLVRGGFLIVDDYGHWMGARKAVNEYFADKPVRLKMIDYTACIVRK